MEMNPITVYRSDKKASQTIVPGKVWTPDAKPQPLWMLGITYSIAGDDSTWECADVPLLKDNRPGLNDAIWWAIKSIYGDNIPDSVVVDVVEDTEFHIYANGVDNVVTFSVRI